MECVHVHKLTASRVIGVNGAADAEPLRFATKGLGLPHLVVVSDTGDDLGLNFEVGVLLVLDHGLNFSVLDSVD